MAITDLFFKRQKRQRGEYPDVYQYNTLPGTLRVQVVHVVRDLLGRYNYGQPDACRDCYAAIHDTACREFGLFQLDPKADDQREGVLNFILQSQDIERVLSVIELVLRVAKRMYRQNPRVLPQLHHAKCNPVEAAEEINARFRENGVGYQFESGEIVRVDSQFLHQEVVKPTLHVLSDKKFAGAEAEFLRAHSHYREGNYPESLNECLKAFESTLKVICDTRSWHYDPTNATAKPLLDIVFKKGLVPQYLSGEFAALRTVLAEGVPTTRNKESGHGAGAKPKDIPQHLASYVLHLAASSILFLVEAEKA